MIPDLWALLVMDHTSAMDEAEVMSLAEFTCLDEFDGPNYYRQPLEGKSIDAIRKVRANNITWPYLLPGTRPIVGAIVYELGPTDAESTPIMAIGRGMGDAAAQMRATKMGSEVADFPIVPTGGDITIEWRSRGILRMR